MFHVFNILETLPCFSKFSSLWDTYSTEKNSELYGVCVVLEIKPEPIVSKMEDGRKSRH